MILDIKENSIVKYFKCIYLVKDFKKLESGRYRISYYYRTIESEKAILHTNGQDEIFRQHIDKIRIAPQEAKDYILEKIKHNISSLSGDNKKNDLGQDSLKVEECIKYLKSKGYLIYKEV